MSSMSQEAQWQSSIISIELAAREKSAPNTHGLTQIQLNN